MLKNRLQTAHFKNAHFDVEKSKVKMRISLGMRIFEKKEHAGRRAKNR